MQVNKQEDDSGKFDFQNTGEHTPVGYPRTNAERKLSDNNKGGASTDADNGDSVEVDYKVGPYPVVEGISEDEADTEGSGTA